MPTPNRARSADGDGLFTEGFAASGFCRTAGQPWLSDWETHTGAARAMQHQWAHSPAAIPGNDRFTITGKLIGRGNDGYTGAIFILAWGYATLLMHSGGSGLLRAFEVRQ